MTEDIRWHSSVESESVRPLTFVSFFKNVRSFVRFFAIHRAIIDKCQLSCHVFSFRLQPLSEMIESTLSWTLDVVDELTSLIVLSRSSKTMITRSKLEHYGFQMFPRPLSVCSNKRQSSNECQQMKKFRLNDSHSDQLVNLFDKTLSTVTPNALRERTRRQPLPLCLSDNETNMPILTATPSDEQFHLNVKQSRRKEFLRHVFLISFPAETRSRRRRKQWKHSFDQTQQMLRRE